MPFGLRNVAHSFQRFIDQPLRGLDFVLADIDDLLVASRSEDEHKIHFDIIFRRLQEYGLAINAEKCQVGVRTLLFLGHEFLPDGFRPTSGPRRLPHSNDYQSALTFSGYDQLPQTFHP